MDRNFLLLFCRAETGRCQTHKIGARQVGDWGLRTVPILIDYFGFARLRRFLRSLKIIDLLAPNGQTFPDLLAMIQPLARLVEGARPAARTKPIVAPRFALSPPERIATAVATDARVSSAASHDSGRPPRRKSPQPRSQGTFASTLGGCLGGSAARGTAGREIRRSNIPERRMISRAW
jgi:hypothetical protein